MSISEQKSEDNQIPAKKRKRLEMLLMEGKSTKDAAFLVETKRQDATIVKRELEAEGKLDLPKIKKEIAENLASFAVSASKRLRDEVGDMPIGKLAIDTAIAIDKLRDLAEGQTVLVEKRMVITQDEINNLLSVTAHVKTIERKPIDEQTQ